MQERASFIFVTKAISQSHRRTIFNLYANYDKKYGHDDYMNVSEDVLRNIFGRFVESFYVFCNYNVEKPYDGWIMVRHHRMKEYFTQFRKNNPSFGRKMLYKDITKSLTEVISTNYQIPDIL